MSFYQELNDLKLDLSEYGEEPLTEGERQRWNKRVLRKLPRRRAGSRARIRLGIAAAAVAAVLTLGLAMPFGQATLARIPFVAGLIERYMNGENPPDYSPYKTAVGETAENAFGKLTLNEVLVEADRLLIGSTFEPAPGVRFNYRTHLTPRVLVNGEDLQLTRGSQSVKESDGRYTIYGDVQFRDLPGEGPLKLRIAYDTLSTPSHKTIAIEEPWVFEVEVSTDSIARDTRTIELNRTIELENGERVTLLRAIVSPVSTLVSFDATKASDSIGFKLVSAGGEEIPYREAHVFDEGDELSYVRFGPIDAEAKKYSLVPIRTLERDKAIGPAVPVEPVKPAAPLESGKPLEPNEAIG